MHYACPWYLLMVTINFSQEVVHKSQSIVAFMVYNIRLNLKLMRPFNISSKALLRSLPNKQTKKVLRTAISTLQAKKHTRKKISVTIGLQKSVNHITQFSNALKPCLQLFLTGFTDFNSLSQHTAIPKLRNFIFVLDFYETFLFIFSEQKEFLLDIIK